MPDSMLPDEQVSGDGSGALSAIFSEPGAGFHAHRRMVVLLQPTIVHDLRTRLLYQLFHPEPLFIGRDDAANIVLDRFRMLAEASTSMEGFMIYNACNAGFGNKCKPSSSVST